MIAVDSDILVYAHRGEAPSNDSAYAILAVLAEGEDQWAVPWPCVAEFLAISTHPRMYNPPSTVDEALDQLDTWLGSPVSRLLGERGSTWSLLRQLIATTRITGPRMYDARIAAICIDHGVEELWTADRDFSQFPQLQTRNPLLDPHD